MYSSLKIPVPRTHSSSVLPPWLWLWLVLYTPELLGTIGLIKTNILIIISGRDGTSSLTYSLPERVPEIAASMLEIILFLGVFTILLPWLRTTFLERKYTLTHPSMLPPTTSQETLVALREICAFVASLAPGLVVTFNASATLIPDYAFVYPIGYRRAGMALSGQILALWRKQRQAAEAVLLHEIAHYRHGDMLVIGAGSLFEVVVKNWLRLTIVFTIIPLVFLIILAHVTSFQEEARLPLIGLNEILTYQIQQIFTTDLFSILLVFFQSLFWSAMLFTTALTAIWCAELNADHFVLDTSGSTAALFQAMQQHTASSSWLPWLLSGMTHPPTALRKWLITHSNSAKGLILLLLIFPFAWFVRLTFLCLWASFYAGLTNPTFIAEELGVGVITFLEGMIPSWFAIAVLLLLWPVLVRYWEHFFGRLQAHTGNLRYRAYLLATGFVIFICLIGAVLSFFPTPQVADNIGTPTSPASTSSHPSGHFQITDHVKIGDEWIVTLTGVQIHSSTGLITAKPGDAFLAIDVSIKNISGQSRRLSSGAQFTLQDTRGTVYDETYVVATPPPEVATNGQVAAGATAQGQLNYEILASIHQFTLSFQADWNNYNPSTSKLTVWDISTGSTGAIPDATSTPLPSLSNTPHLQQAYQGTVTNTTDNANVSADTSLSSVQQDQQGHINGYMKIQPPLTGSGPFKGTISHDGMLHFTVTPDDGSGYAAIDFTGSLHQDGSMDGTYTLPGTGQGGTWQFKPN